MKWIGILSFLILGYNTQAQRYSSRNMEKMVEHLFNFSSDIAQDTMFIVYDAHTVESDQQLDVDNDVHQLFLDIVELGTNDDLMTMAYTRYPNIQVYGYWGLLKKKEFQLARRVYDNIVNEEGEIRFKSTSDRLLEMYLTEALNFVREQEIN